MDTDQVDNGLRISLLGQFRLCIGDRDLIDAAWPRRKAQALLKLLALQPGRSLHREQVYEALWPDLTADSAAAQFRQNLYYLRSALAEHEVTAEPVLVRGNLVALAPDVRIDVEEFRQRAKDALAARDGAAPYEAALVAYGGDLLPDDLYEEWALRAREELHELRDQLLLELGELLASDGRLAAAAARLEELHKADPLSEQAHRSLMRVYALSGNRDRALRQYDRCRESLKRELEVEPSAETEALYRDILAGRVEPNVAARGRAAAPATTAAGDGGKRSRWWSGRTVRLGAAFAALGIIAAGTLGGLALAGLFAGSANEAPFFRHAVVSVTSSGEARLIEGACPPGNLVYRVEGQGTSAGLLPGTVHQSYTTTFLAKTGCTLGLAEGATQVSNGEDSFKLDNAGFVSLVAPANSTTTHTLGLPRNPMLISRGSGRFANIVGRGLCQSTNSAASVDSNVVKLEAQTDCSIEYAFGRSPSQSIIAEGGFNDTKIAIRGSLSGEIDTVSIAVVYMNASDAALHDLALTLPNPYGLAVEVRRGDEPFTPASGTTWVLPDLGPGDVERFYLDVQVLSANRDTIELQPEISGPALKEPIRTTLIQLDVIH